MLGHFRLNFNKLIFYMIRFARGLVPKKRQTATWKSLITFCDLCFPYSSDEFKSISSLFQIYHHNPTREKIPSLKSLRLRVVPLSLSTSFVTGKKTARKKWPRKPLAPRSSRGHFFLANFFRVTHNGLGERGTTRSLVFPRCRSRLG